MTDDELLREVATTFGRLKSVAGVYDDTRRPTAVFLTFERGVVEVHAEPDDDSVVVRRAAVPSGALDLSRRAPWDSAVGGTVLWFWTLQNHRGYTDGVQMLVVRSPGDEINLQMVVVASQVSVHAVTEITDR